MQHVQKVGDVEPDIERLAFVRDFQLFLGFLLLAVGADDLQLVGAEHETHAAEFLVRKNRRALQRLQKLGALKLELLGMAENGRELLRKAQELRPDVVLVDISMPMLDGIEAARKIREHHPTARILVLTGSSISTDVDRSRQAGVAGFLTKDRLGTQLLDAILDLGSR